MFEKRQFLRIPLSVPVKFKQVGYVSIVSNVSRDLSIAGIRFLSSKFMAVSTCIKVELQMNNSLVPLDFIARIVWIKSLYDYELYEVGARILEINEENSALLFKVFSNGNVAK